MNRRGSGWKGGKEAPAVLSRWETRAIRKLTAAEADRARTRARKSRAEAEEASAAAAVAAAMSREVSASGEKLNRDEAKAAAAAAAAAEMAAERVERALQEPPLRHADVIVSVAEDGKELVARIAPTR